MINILGIVTNKKEIVLLVASIAKNLIKNWIQSAELSVGKT